MPLVTHSKWAIMAVLSCLGKGSNIASSYWSWPTLNLFEVHFLITTGAFILLLGFKKNFIVVDELQELLPFLSPGHWWNNTCCIQGQPGLRVGRKPWHRGESVKKISDSGHDDEGIDHLRLTPFSLFSGPPDQSTCMFTYSLIQEWSGRVFWYVVGRHYANGRLRRTQKQIKMLNNLSVINEAHICTIIYTVLQTRFAVFILKHGTSSGDHFVSP